MTAIGYAWEVGAAAFIVIALMYWCFLEGSEWEDDEKPWNAFDEVDRVLREGREAKR